METKIADLEYKIKPKTMIKVPLVETGLHELLKCIDSMAKHDRFLHRAGFTKERDWTQEDKVLKDLGKPWIEKHTLLPDIPE